LGIRPGGDVVDRDLQLPVCRNAVVESWGNIIWEHLAKKSKNLFVLR
jgi:hypothetical protein